MHIMSTEQDKVVEWARTPNGTKPSTDPVVDRLQTDRGKHKKVVITFAQDGKKCGAKHYAIQSDGSVSKVTHSTSSGKMLVMESTVHATAILDRPDMYAVCSVPKDKPVVAEVGPETMLEYGVESSGAALTRSGKHFEFRAGVPGMMVFDLDPKGSDECFPPLEYKDPAAYHAALVGVCPHGTESRLTSRDLKDF
jgi:hypothetical protein